MKYNAESGNRDHIRILNNYLQGHPSGNLTQFLSWVYSETGPSHQKTHYASVKCESVFQPNLEPVLSHAVKGRTIGSGEGFAKTHARQEAAAQALSTIQNGGIQDLLD